MISLTCATAAPVTKKLRIVGGNTASASEYPWAVAIYQHLDGHRYLCGGSIISPTPSVYMVNGNNDLIGRPTWILTAAHCVEKQPDVTQYDILFGNVKRSSALRAKVSRIIKYPNYDSLTRVSDIALIAVDSAYRIHPAYVPMLMTPSSSASAPGYYETAGWGVTKPGGEDSDDLLKVTVPAVSFKECSAAYPGIINDSREICAGAKNKDACQGDSGGPLVDANRLTLYGIVAWGKGCAKLATPGVYTRVSAYFNWIFEQTQDARVAIRTDKGFYLNANDTVTGTFGAKNSAIVSDPYSNTSLDVVTQGREGTFSLGYRGYQMTAQQGGGVAPYPQELLDSQSKVLSKRSQAFRLVRFKTKYNLLTNVGNFLAFEDGGGVQNGPNAFQTQARYVGSWEKYTLGP